MGTVHGGWCVGCCWAPMVVLFAVGLMSITRMVVVAAIVAAGKVSRPVSARRRRSRSAGSPSASGWPFPPAACPVDPSRQGVIMDGMPPTPHTQSLVINVAGPGRAHTVADRGRVLRVVQLRGDLPVPDDRRRPRRPLDVRHLFRRALLAIDEGHVGEVDLSGLAAALIRYDDDERARPGRIVAPRRRARGREQRPRSTILLGSSAATVLELPWVRSPAI